MTVGEFKRLCADAWQDGAGRVPMLQTTDLVRGKVIFMWGVFSCLCADARLTAVETAAIADYLEGLSAKHDATAPIKWGYVS